MREGLASSPLPLRPSCFLLAASQKDSAGESRVDSFGRESFSGNAYCGESYRRVFRYGMVHRIWNGISKRSLISGSTAWNIFLAAYILPSLIWSYADDR